MKYPMLQKVLAQNAQLSDEEIKVLKEIKTRLGKRTFPEPIMKKLIQMGLAAGDYSRAYVTDKGDDFLENLKT